MSMLQIELIGYTHVRAHDLKRSESGSWVIMSQSNMNLALGEPSDPVGKEWKVPSRYWENIPLPNTVAPSFDTCNLSRTYELEVRVGFSHGSGIASVKPELIVLPLRLAVKVYSGIAPPPALLQRMAASHIHIPAGAQFPATALSPGSNVPLYPPPTPMTPSYAHQQTPVPPGGTTSSHFQPSSPRPPQPPGGDDEEAPPSYEDAMADEIAPVDGPRRDYSVPAPETDRRDSGFGLDSKGGSGLGRRVSERLFASNGIGRGRGTTSFATGHSRHSSGDSFADEAGALEGAATTATGPSATGLAEGTGVNRQAPAPPPRVTRKPTLPPSFEEAIGHDRESRTGR